MYMLRFGRPPFVAPKLLQLYYQIIHEPLELPPNDIKDACDPQLLALLKIMLTKEPSKRASLKAVLAHPWLRAVPRHQKNNKFGNGPSPPPPSMPPKNRVLTDFRSSIPPPTMQKHQQITVTKNEMRSAISQRPQSSTNGDHRRLADDEEQRRTASFVQRQSRSMLRTNNHPNFKNNDSPRPSSSKSISRQNSDVVLRGVDNNTGDQDDFTINACDEDLDDVFRGVLSSRKNEEPAPLPHLSPLNTPLIAPPTLCSSHAKLMSAWHSRRGQRPTQEDRVTVIPELSALDASLTRGTAYVAVFDGHDGTKCVDFLQHELHMFLVRRPDFSSDIRQALISAFVECDQKVTKILEDESGSTALVALIDHQRLIVAHAGDSKCVLSTGSGLALPLTCDHRLTTRPDEVRRIKAAGGLIVNSRLNGTLAVSRAFGDLPHKNNFGPPTVTAAPEITVRNLEPQDEFILLATDGLFDAISIQAAINFVRVELHRHHNLQHAARNLTAEALRCGSIDNVSVVILAFKEPPDSSNLSEEDTDFLRHSSSSSLRTKKRATTISGGSNSSLVSSSHGSSSHNSSGGTLI
uniref:PPM-type phosphatase domain-containing protein n=1 Tax=Aureoumbra lagunensis TaxID=44058 RepID=A0A7S3NHX4_9STRA